MKQAILPSVLAVAALAACGKGDPSEAEGCLTNERFFALKVWGPTLSSDCYQCHNAQGQAKDTAFVLQGSGQTGFLDANYQMMESLARVTVDGQSLLLVKPTGGMNHGGGTRMAQSDTEYQNLSGLIDRFAQPVSCGSDPVEQHIAQIELMSPKQLLRKLSLNLGGRLPTADEYDLAATQGISGVQRVLDDIMNEDAFYERIKEIYNDQLLTDRYLLGSDALNLLSDDDYGDRFWFDAVTDDNLARELERAANVAVARQPLELIEHVIRNDRPFTEIVTADYLVVNPFSARSFGVSAAHRYDDGDAFREDDARDFRPARVPGLPHAGILTSHMFLNRFPTTDTNVNRHRSRTVYRLFLATDVLKLAERPVDPTQIQDFNPTLYNPECNVCHAQIDPIAGAFQNWDQFGRYRPPESGWHETMRPPGFGDQTVPTADAGESLAWLGARIARDERFATAATYTMYAAITGRTPLAGQTTGMAPDAANAHFNAFLAQDASLKSVSRRFIESGYNFKALVKALAANPYVRAVNRKSGSESEENFVGAGSGRLLTPEQLDRKIEAVLGTPWTRNGRRVLLSDNEFRIFYGGIDSDTIIKRISTPSGVMVNIADRMAIEMACQAVPLDFFRRPDERHLFPAVETSFVPLDDNGFEVPGAVSAIKENLRYLHWRLLGEAASEEVLEASYDLFRLNWREGRASVRSGGISSRLAGACQVRNNPETGDSLENNERIEYDSNFAIRAWMSVVVYLLTDWHFLYE